MAKVIYLPNSPQSAQVRSVVQSSAMPFENYSGLIVPNDGFTYENVQAFCDVYGYDLSSPYYIFLIMTETYRDPMTAQVIQTTNRGVLICFETNAKVYTITDPITDQTYNFAYWWSDNEHTSRVNVKYLIGYNGWNSQYQWHIDVTNNNWTNTGSAPVGSFASTCDIYVMAATVPFEWSGTPYTPTIPDERVFTKDYNSYKMYVGVAVNNDSEYDNHLYQTKTYKINLRWQSLRTGENYSFDMAGRLVHNTAFILTPSGIISAPFYSFSYDTDNAAPTAQALRMPLGAFENESDIPSEYSALTDVRAISEITLQQLIDYMQTQTAGANEQDIFTEIFADFMDVNNTVIETKSCDYSSLFGSEDIDVNGGTVNDPNDDPSINDTNVYTDNIELTTPTLTATGVFNRCYVLDGNGVNDLCDYLYNASDSVFDEIIDGVLTRGNPIESLIDLRLYPFDVRSFTGAGTPEFIKFGRTQTTVAASKLPHNANAVISLGSCVVPRYYNSFLDYETDAKLYIPFCGVCDLPIDRVLNHTISIKLIVDYITGACCAVVYCDALPLVYQSGVIGVSIPMTATDSAEFGKSIIGNLITGVTQAAGKNPAGAVRSLTDTASKIWNGSDIQTAGASSPQVALYQPKNAYLLLSIVNPPSEVYGDVYASTIGYETFMPVSAISWMNGSGFTVFDNVRLNVGQATDAERNEILSLLSAGVFM